MSLFQGVNGGGAGNGRVCFSRSVITLGKSWGLNVEGLSWTWCKGARASSSLTQCAVLSIGAAAQIQTLCLWGFLLRQCRQLHRVSGGIGRSNTGYHRPHLERAKLAWVCHFFVEWLLCVVFIDACIAGTGLLELKLLI